MTEKAPVRSHTSSLEINELQDFDRDWAEQYLKTCSNPWTNGILTVKTIELICVGLCAACTNMQQEATRRHIRAALSAGASRDELMMVLKMGAVMSIHSMSLGAPILFEEAKEAGVSPSLKQASTPACDHMRSIGQWNNAWDPFYELDPIWTDQIMASGGGIYGSGLMSAKQIELFSIAFDASITHMYAPGTRRHIKAALKAGATAEEIMEVLKVCVSFGFESYRLGADLIGEELANFDR